MRLDPDVRAMNANEARQELMRVRQLLRAHRKRDNNNRCWHADEELYARALPERELPGRMTGPKEKLLQNCSRYIDRQQCRGENCSYGTSVACADCGNRLRFGPKQQVVPCSQCGAQVSRTGEPVRVT